MCGKSGQHYIHQIMLYIQSRSIWKSSYSCIIPWLVIYLVFSLIHLLKAKTLLMLMILLAMQAITYPLFLQHINFVGHSWTFKLQRFILSLSTILSCQDATSGAHLKVYKGHTSFVTCCHADANSARYQIINNLLLNEAELDLKYYGARGSC